MPVLCPVCRDISTHSLTRRLTAAWLLDRRQPWNFNSQPHKEADDIHIAKVTTNTDFNSQPHKEADS